MKSNVDTLLKQLASSLTQAIEDATFRIKVAQETLSREEANLAQYTALRSLFPTPRGVEADLIPAMPSEAAQTAEASTPSVKTSTGKRKRLPNGTFSASTMSPLGETLRVLRKKENLSQAESSRRAKISQSNLCKLESGKSHFPTKNTLQRLAKVYRVSWTTLLDAGKHGNNSTSS